ncbi:MAG: ergothioneine biosynthesis glutamate--cysteine ligase EgtA [Pseudonocardia sp.]|nr:ergothioneine biosynthesis glutamate--cysteine ligase EgtA [Pseudonocardia sp.]
MAQDPGLVAHQPLGAARSEDRSPAAAGQEPIPLPEVRITRRAEAEAYVASVCFKHGPPRLLGVELEWILHRADDPTAPVDLARLVSALGAHAPASLRTNGQASPARPLPAGSTVTVEPGGQVELASPPLAGLGPLTAAVAQDIRHLHGLLAAQGLHPQPRAADPLRPPRRVLRLPRYTAMESSFDRYGPHGRSGMSSTSAVQVALDAGETHAVAARWAALHALGPVLVGAFANSPVLHGNRTGWKSSRMASWFALDPARTAPPPVTGEDPAREWAERVVSTPVLCVRGEGRWETPRDVTFADWIDGALPSPPTFGDLEYHISTLFPPVRPRGFLEVRYVDGQAGDEWMLPVAVLAAVTSSPAAVDRLREICEPVRDLWVAAAQDGLGHPALARAAAKVFTLAVAELPRTGAGAEVAARLADVTERRVLAGRCPADEPWPGDGPGTAGPPAAPFPPGLYSPVPSGAPGPARAEPRPRRTPDHRTGDGRAPDRRAAEHRGPDVQTTEHRGRETRAARPDQTEGAHP